MKKLALFAMFVVMGLAFAFPNTPDYIRDQYYKAECIYRNSEGMAGFIDDDFGACNGECPGEEIMMDMESSMEGMQDHLNDNMSSSDLASFEQEYMYFLSLFNEIRWNYLYYGLDYVLEGGDETWDMAELMDEFGDYNSQVLSCFAGGSQVT